MVNYRDLVDNVATLMKYWYEDYVGNCYKENTPALTPKEYVSTTNSMYLTIRDTLTSNDAVMCVISEHIYNPWSVMAGREPDYGCDDAYVRFKYDCAKAFYDEVDPTTLAMINNNHWND